MWIIHKILAKVKLVIKLLFFILVTLSKYEVVGTKAHVQENSDKLHTDQSVSNAIYVVLHVKQGRPPI